MRGLASRYLAFVSHAFDRPNGRFRNFLSYSRQWMEPHGSEDSHARALWALGWTVTLGAPVSAVDVPLRRSMSRLALGGLLAIVAAGALDVAGVAGVDAAGQAEGGVEGDVEGFIDRLQTCLAFSGAKPRFSEHPEEMADELLRPGGERVSDSGVGKDKLLAHAHRDRGTPTPGRGPGAVRGIARP